MTKRRILGVITQKTTGIPTSQFMDCGLNIKVVRSIIGMFDFEDKFLSFQVDMSTTAQPNLLMTISSLQLASIL